MITVEAVAYLSMGLSSVAVLAAGVNLRLQRRALAKADALRWSRR